ncbi:hypothetical protein JTB14_033307 [Gonioctena quinquepunctata]|nr:hypothetical protein JTB14_033307 [Gonioctena quinquepunctata]
MADILPSGSENENLSDSDDDYVPNPNTKDAVSSDEGDISVSDSEDEEPLSNVSARGKQKYTWTKVRGDQDNSLNPQFTSQDIKEGPEMGRPIHYFGIFFSNQLLDLIVEQSNLYACQVDPNKSLNLTRSELRIFIGTIIYMSIFGLLRHRLCWSQTCSIPRVADSMSRKRYEEIKKTLHFNNNGNFPNDRNDMNRDKLFKLRPFLDNLQQKFSNQVKPQMLCVDEQIVPFKGISSLEQYNPKKSNKWGYKIFVPCDSGGLIHYFEVYTRKILPASGKEDIGASGNIVLRLASIIPKHKNYLLFFDNWFTSMKLLTTLQMDGIYFLDTIRKDRIPGLQFPNDKIMKKQGRGTFEEYTTTVQGVPIIALKWFDITAWIRYKIVMVNIGLPKKDIIDSLGFRGEVAEGLCHSGNDPNSRKRGRPSGSIEREFQDKRKRSQTKPIPQFDVRTDRVGHFPCGKEQRQRCKKPNCGLKTYFYCIKCEVYLYKTKNCFAEFHI